jgi:hypothetical protein
VMLVVTPMSISYERDDARRRVAVRIQGIFQPADVLAIMARQRDEETWTYGILYDLRGVTGHPTMDDLRQILIEAATLDQGERGRGPVALLATEPILYGRLCAYAALGRPMFTIEVFRNWDEADLWLTGGARKV